MCQLEINIYIIWNLVLPVEKETVFAILNKAVQQSSKGVRVQEEANI
jgi:hypothetical protein